MRAMDLQENINAVNNVKWSIVEWFLLVFYFWIIKEGLEKCISSKENYYGSYLCMQDCRGISKHARLIALCTDWPSTVVMMQDIADGRSCDSPACSWNRNAGRGTLHSSLCQNPHFFQLLHLCASFSVSVTSSLLQLKLEEKERERTSLCKSREYVRPLSATQLYQPYLHSRGRLCHSVIIGLIGLRIPLLVFSSAIPKNLADDPYWGTR